MKRVAVPALLFLLLTAAAPADPSPAMSDAARGELRAAFDALKAKHLRRATIDWPSLENEAYALAGKAQTPADTYPAIRFVVSQLGEHHSQLWTADQARAIREGHAVGDAKPWRMLLPVPDRDGTIGYVFLPGHEGTAADDARYVATLRQALGDFRAQGVCRYLVDLRNNGGGNMFPMLAGLTSLLGPAPYFYWEGGTDSLVPVTLAGQPDYGADAPRAWQAPVAVMINRRTGSSGEFTALAFEGRPRTMFFGEPTAGLVTGNEAATLPDGALLLIASVRPRDRINRPYTVAIVPDIETPPPDPKAPHVDPAENAAMAWLKTQPCARP